MTMSRCRDETETREERLGRIEHPTSPDVILGRGSLHAWHPGNRMFIQRVDECVASYDTAKTKSVKSQIIQEVYDATTGRFLMRASGSDQFVEISEQQAKEKISQIIRYRKLVASQNDQDDEGGDDGGTGGDGSGSDNDMENEGLDDISPIDLQDYMLLLDRSFAESPRPVAVAPHPANEEELFSDEELMSVLGWFSN